ncbi:retrovirus-related pol polyprotein from transposon TNT 1-94 [Tanacetum coccineum]
MVPRAVLMKSGLVLINTVRQVNVSHTKTIVNAARPMLYLSKKAHSTVKRPIHKNTSFKNSNFNQRVNIVKDKNVNTVRPKTVVNAARPKAEVNAIKGNNVNAFKASGNLQMDLQVPRVIDSGCSRHMTGNMSYLTNYEEIDGGYIAFGGNPKGGKITGKAHTNGTEFKNREMNQFCEMKGILRQFSVAITPQQNGVAERRNKTLIKAARTMLADSKLPTTFWAKAVNNTCYVQNRVLVVKPHNKTPYELFHGRTPTLSFMRPFGCLFTILNTIDHLGKFDGKADEGFFIGYSLNSKAFRVFNSRTRIVEENLHIMFSESTLDVVGTQSNGFAGTKASDNAGQARMGTKPVKDYILLHLWTTYLPYSQDSKSSHDDGSKPSSDYGKMVDEDPRKDSEYKDQKKEDNVNSTNNVNTVSSAVNAAGTNEVNAVGGKTSIELLFDPNMPSLEDYSILDFSKDDEDDGAMADMNNLDTTIQVSPIPTTRIHKDHPLKQVIGDLQSATQTRKMSMNLEEHGFVSTIKERTNHKDFQNCLFACFLSHEEPKKVIHASKDPSWIEAMQEELL